MNFNIFDIVLVIQSIVLILTSLIIIFFLMYCKKLTHYLENNRIIKTDRQPLPFISIIIPTYNEAILIDDKIQNTLSIDYPIDKHEIIMIDSASTDGTAKIAERFENISVVKQAERKGKSSALAEAFALVKGEIIVITDADAMLDQNALHVVAEYLSEENVGAVTGKQVLTAHGNKRFQENEESYRDIFDLIRNAESNMESTMIFNGPLMAFRREILEAPAPNSVADDTEMAIKVIRKGYRALYAPEAIFYENIPLSNKSRLKQKERRAQGLVQSFWRHRDLLFNKKYGQFGIEIFPAEFAVHIVLPFALSISIITTVIGAFFNFTATIAIVLVFVIINLAYAIFVYTHIGKYMKKTNMEQTGSAKRIATTAVSFLQLQYALLMGALKLMVFGGHFKWEQISDARYK